MTKEVSEGRPDGKREARPPDLAAKEFTPRRGSGNRAASGQADVARQTLHSPVASYGSTTAARGTKSVSEKLRISQPKLEALCHKYGIAKLSLFGSAARNELTPESDVDLMVEFSPDSCTSLFDITQMQDEISDALGGRKADIATPEILRNPFRRESIVPDLKLIYEAR